MITRRCGECLADFPAQFASCYQYYLQFDSGSLDESLPVVVLVWLKLVCSLPVFELTSWGRAST